MNTFQQRLTSDCRSMLRAVGIETIEFDAKPLRGLSPREPKEHYFFAVTTFRNHQIEIFIYEDEAEYKFDTDGTRFEKPDYNSDMELGKDFLSSLREKLGLLAAG